MTALTFRTTSRRKGQLKMGELIVAAVQIACDRDVTANLDKLEMHVREAARRGARLVVLQELFEGPYFCIDRSDSRNALARPFRANKTVSRFASLARELEIVLPVSFFEEDDGRRFNSLTMIDADGKVLGLYRKSHIPDSPGYYEKYYFADGDTGFVVHETAVGRIGAGICWDQWFPEAARCMVLKGAEILIYPTAIGSEPADPAWDTRDHWQRVMQGHAAANLMSLDPGKGASTASEGGKAKSLKEKAEEEFRSFLILFFYLWLLFSMFVLNQEIILREEGINFTMQGFALINALVFAKVMMIYEMFDPWRWLRKGPLIYPILFETALLTVLFFLVHILEKVIEGAIHGKAVKDSIPTIGGGGLPGILSTSFIVFVALLPFFGLRNLGLALGADRLRTLLLGPVR